MLQVKEIVPGAWKQVHCVCSSRSVLASLPVLHCHREKERFS